MTWTNPTVSISYSINVPSSLSLSLSLFSSLSLSLSLFSLSLSFSLFRSWTATISCASQFTRDDTDQGLVKKTYNKNSNNFFQNDGFKRSKKQPTPKKRIKSSLSLMHFLSLSLLKFQKTFFTFVVLILCSSAEKFFPSLLGKSFQQC